MSYIKTLSPEQADEPLKSVYDEILETRGKIAEVHKIQSLNPDALKAHMDLYLSTMFGKSPLKRYQREMIAVVVSSANRCEYCIHHHEQALLAYWKDHERTRKLIESHTLDDLTEQEKGLCTLAKNLTLMPSDNNEKQIEALREAGFSDRAILDAVQIIAYFNFVNRMVLALGVEFDDEEMKGYTY